MELNDTNNAPRTAQQAVRHARCFDKAKMMQAEGYRASTDYTSGLSYWDVYKPGNFTVSDYSVHVGDRTCTCPDFDTHKDTCKHILFVNIIRAEQAAELAGFEEQCKEHDANHGPDFPPADTVRALMLAEFRRAECNLAANPEPFSTRAEKSHKRVQDCETALRIYDEVTSKILCNYYSRRLDKPTRA